eukprot:GEMP01020732.1.p1 GENE.GEMP01020732.1~~GEMP01020732.1.p1  ORF type:complete len:622 (+),score=120.59 GEMP01020732.1:52-1917(+)
MVSHYRLDSPEPGRLGCATTPRIPTPRITKEDTRDFKTFELEFQEFQEQQLAANENINNLLEIIDAKSDGSIDIGLGGTDDGLSVLSEEVEAPLTIPSPNSARFSDSTRLVLSSDVLDDLMQEGAETSSPGAVAGPTRGRSPNAKSTTQSEKRDPFQAFSTIRTPEQRRHTMDAFDVSEPSTSSQCEGRGRVGSQKEGRGRGLTGNAATRAGRAFKGRGVCIEVPEELRGAESKNKARRGEEPARSKASEDIPAPGTPDICQGQSWSSAVASEIDSYATPSISRRHTISTPDAFKASQCDTSLLPISQQPEDCGWSGWTAVADAQGSLFYYHSTTQQSVWQPPEELEGVLGRWEIVEDQSGSYWHNALLRVSVWRDPSAVTNVFQAAMDNNVVFLQLYNDVGGDLNTADPKRRRALHYACASGSREACQLIISSGAMLDALDMNRATPLLFAARYGYSNICRLLIDARASVNARNSLGETCLHEGAQLGQVDCVVLLLLVKADSEAKDNKNLRPVDVAKMNNHEETAEILQADMIKQQAHADFGDEAGESGRSITESEEESESEPLNLKIPNQTTQNIVQKIKPFLKGVQGAVNTLFPVKADLGDSNQFIYDHETHLWVSR